MDMNEDEKRVRIAAFKAALEQDINEAERLKFKAIYQWVDVEKREDELLRLRTVYEHSFPNEDTVYARADAYLRRRENPQ
jgi:hypothetical protein